MEELIKLDAYPIRGLVGRLLQDKTTRKNIMFASDSYADYGAGYRDDSQMTEGVLLGFASCDIQPRVYKAASEQTERTRKRAEVFTPAWIVDQMNNHCDAEWFGRADVFNHQDGQEWTVSTEPIVFPEGKDWKQYVDSRRLEITCGEAPYIVSRYDTSTGEIIPIERRIGILDRKLRIVNENAVDEAEWFKWAFRAFQSVYGYEYQGDNLLIARMNLLYTLADYIEARWQRQATQKELEKFLNVICWNIWQMDGMNDTPPYGIPSDEVVQMSLFDNEEETADDEIVYCKIYDWRADISKLFKGLKKRGKGMKFDFVIGNPPYQEDDGGGNGASARPVYQYFVEAAKQISNSVVLITPSRWFSGGKGLDQFRNNMLEDNRIKAIHDFPDASNVFPNVQIKGGVSYFVWEKDYSGDCTVYSHDTEISVMKRPLLEEGCDTFIRWNAAISILRKVNAKPIESMTTLVSVRMPFGIPNTYKGNKTKTNDTDLLIYVSGNDRQVRGTTAFAPIDVITKGQEMIGWEKVYISKAGSGSDSFPHPILTKPFYGKPNTICNESYLVIGKFNNKNECDNAISYICSRFFRFLVLLKKSTQNAPRGVYEFVPLQDFTENSDIDWTQPIAAIDQQLYQKYNLTPDEIKFIETHVKEME